MDGGASRTITAVVKTELALRWTVNVEFESLQKDTESGISEATSEDMCGCWAIRA